MGDFDHHLHGSIVTEFEEEFAAYVGAKYACSLSSATNAIFLIALSKRQMYKVPAMLPAVVVNAIVNAGCDVKFIDNWSWVGGSYLLHDYEDFKVIDSAQRVDRNQFKNEASDEDLMIFSFYPTKPVGGIDGGMIVSNDKEKIDYFRTMVMNGMSYSENNWDRVPKYVGWKMYMSSAQAYVALQNLRRLDEKKERLSQIKAEYNKHFNLDNTSDHLYRINSPYRDKVKDYAYQNEVMTGIHYTPLHHTRLYGNMMLSYDLNGSLKLEGSNAEGATTLSLPFHEALTDSDVKKVISVVEDAS
jgi:dTDP-4-amino-4,6-dideoxygalactose transaminase